MSSDLFTATLQDEVATLQAQHPVLAAVLDKAYTLLVSGHVFLLEDGASAHVQSERDPSVSYLTNGTCQCPNAQYRTAPCKHRFALRLYQRTVARLVSDPEERWEPVPGGLTASDTTPQPLYEAPCSLNCHVTIAGRQVQVTLRGQDELEVLTRLEALLARYPLAQPTPPAASQPQGQGKDVCPVHQVAMRWHEGKDGRKGWYSHRTEDGSWCKGK